MVVARQPRFGGQRQRAVHHALQRGLDELRVIERVVGHARAYGAAFDAGGSVPAREKWGASVARCAPNPAPTLRAPGDLW